MNNPSEPIPTIFLDEAPAYYQRNIPVIPLHHQEKRPIPTGWARYSEEMPTPEDIEHWLVQCRRGNLGLVCGPQANVTMIDIDTTNEEYTNVILAVLEAAAGGIASPWKRVGKKGCMLAYRYNGVGTFRIKDVQDNMLVEFLSSKTQVVLPPSIHPDTKLPYTANVPLLDVIHDLPILDDQIEAMLRGALKDSGIELSMSGWTRVSDWVPKGARDVKMTSIAGHYAYVVMRGERSIKEAIELLKAWYSTEVEKVAGDDIDIDKGLVKLIEFIKRDVYEKHKILPPKWDEGLLEDEKRAMGLDFTEENEEWSFDKLKEVLQNNFEIYEPDTGERLQCINNVMKRISMSKQLNTMEVERLLRYIAEASGLRLPVGTLKARIRELAKGDLKGTDHTEIAKATISDLEQVAPLRFHASRFWTWNGSHWIIKPEAEIMRHIATEYGALNATKKHSDHRGVLKTMASLVGQGIKTVDTRGVNFANGFLLQKGELIPHLPAYGMTYTLPFRYVPEQNGKAFKFHAMLERTWNGDYDSDAKMMALKQAMCITLFGMGPAFSRAILLYGAAKSGKSCLLEVVRSLVPDSAVSNVPPEKWSDRFMPSRMTDKILNICGELDERRPISGQKFKSIISGEEMTGEFKGKDPYSFRPVATHWFASNHLPVTDDSSDAFNRRWLILRFNRPVTDDIRVPNYGELVVAEEREAIAAWVVEAAQWMKNANEYTLPPSHFEELEKVANYNNSIRFFLKEGPVKIGGPSPQNESTPEWQLYSAYMSFCSRAVGAPPVGLGKFRRTLEDLSMSLPFNQVKDGKNYSYVGITLVDEKGPSLRAVS